MNKDQTPLQPIFSKIPFQIFIEFSSFGKRFKLGQNNEQLRRATQN